MSRKERNPIEVGTVFGRLTVISQAIPTSEGNSYRYYPCKCSCGNTTSPRKDTLLNGQSKSCGCLAKEVASERARTHGLSKHRIADKYYSMLKRCNNPKRKDYKHYGGRGITICPRWADKSTGLANFIEDMYPSYIEGYELERMNNDGNYEPGNCTWATRQSQVLNRRFEEGAIGIPKYIEYNGLELHLAGWEEKTGISARILCDRIGKLGWSVEKALTTPPRVDRTVLIVDGVEYSTREMFRHTSNFNNMCSSLGIRTYEYLFNKFGNIGEVRYYLNKTWHTYNVHVDVDVTDRIVALTERFQDLLLSKGVDYAN